MPETAESHSHSLPTNRNCVIELTSLVHDFVFSYPRVHMSAGFVFSPPQPTLFPDCGVMCSFVRDHNTAAGAKGVLTYDMFDILGKWHRIGKMAVMFSVPCDYGSDQNRLAVGVFGVDAECDEELFQKMYKSEGGTDFVRHCADGSGLKYESTVVDVRACMSNGGRAIIKLELYNKMK